MPQTSSYVVPRSLPRATTQSRAVDYVRRIEFRYSCMSTGYPSQHINHLRIGQALGERVGNDLKESMCTKIFVVVDVGLDDNAVAPVNPSNGIFQAHAQERKDLARQPSGLVRPIRRLRKQRIDPERMFGPKPILSGR